MVKLRKLKKFLDKELRVKKIKDSSENGLQVKCSSNVRKIGFAVDACLSTFDKAKYEGVDLLIVHHGLKWKPQKYKKITRIREKFLRRNKISLYGVHLPLDAHTKYGNNVGLANILELEKKKRFAPYGNTMVGYKGVFKNEKKVEDIAKILNKALSTKSKIFIFGKEKIKTIGIVSGGGGENIEDAVRAKLDCLILGEMSLSEYHRVRDFGLTTILSGHYATETVGVKLLMNLIKEKFNIETIFIDNKTGV
jgi:dinuclear metal center YbgI/SA1388 family protein